MKGGTLSELLRNILIGFFVGTICTAFGQFQKQQRVMDECEKLGRVVLDDRVFECREMGK